MRKVSVCLWFDGQAQEVMEFYTSVFKDSRVIALTKRGETVPGDPESVLAVVFEIAGQEIMALNGGPEYTLSPAASLVVKCEDQDELDYYWDELCEGGQPVQCGWLTDKFGVSWQVVPALIEHWFTEGDQVKLDRMMQALLPMIKLDIETLRHAYEGE